MFKPEYAILAVIGVCLLLGILLMGGQGVAANSQTSTLAKPTGSTVTSAPPTPTSPAALGKGTLDMALLAKVNSIDEADNARWALVRDTPAGASLYQAKSGVDWTALRKISQKGLISLPAGASWSFNQTYQEGVGYKIASGVLAGGHCALATVLRAAAKNAGLVTTFRQHRSPIPGFALADSVNIWWGRDDLVVRNPTKQNLALSWVLTPESLIVRVIPAAN